MSKRRSKQSKSSQVAKKVKIEQRIEEGESQASSNISDYERTILENIRRNNEVLLELNISQARLSLRTANSSPKRKHTLRMKKRTKQLQPTRQSLRIRKLEPDGVTAIPDRPVLNTTDSNTWHKPRQSGQIKMVLASDAEEEASSSLLCTLSDLMTKTKQTTPLKLNSDCISYKNQMEQLKVNENHVTKVCPERILSILIHDLQTKTLVFGGDKRGRLGLWDVDSKEENNVLVFEPHTQGVVTMAINCNDASKLLTCSYDGTIRCADFEKTVFDEVCALDEDDTYFTYMVYGSTCSQTLLASSGDGQIHIVDCRENKSNNPRYQLHNKTIKCLDVHPTNWNIFVTSTNRGTISLWDLRNIKGPGSSICSLQAHSRSISSVFFSPITGKQILSTSMDDYILVYDVNESHKTKPRPTCMFRHNNNTGRWLSTFQARWDPKTDTCFAVGSMKYPRQVDIYSSDHKAAALTYLQHENFTNVTSRLAFHPSSNMVAGGNSTGKVFLWSIC